MLLLLIIFADTVPRKSCSIPYGMNMPISTTSSMKGFAVAMMPVGRRRLCGSVHLPTVWPITMIC